MTDIKLLKITYKVFEQYRKIKGNNHVSYLLARKKLTRNVHLAHKFINEELKDVIIYFYGNLKITVRGDRIINIKNFKGEQHDWFWFDENEYNRLNKLLGIPSGKKLTQSIS